MRFDLLLMMALFAGSLAASWLLHAETVDPVALARALPAALLTCSFAAGAVIVGLSKSRRRADRALQAIDSTNQGCWVLDAQGAFVEVNEAYCRLLGDTKAEVRRMKIADFEAVATQDRSRGPIQRVLRNGNERFETRHRHRDGRWIDLEITVTAVDRGLFVAFLRDVSQRKAAEERTNSLAFFDLLTNLPNRRLLRGCGYTPCAWKQGFNFGPRQGVLDACRDFVRQTVQRHTEPVSLIGWRLGGIYAREIAEEQPEHTRCVIILGTFVAGHPRATNAWRLYELVSGQSVHDRALADTLRRASGCPTTSIYSKTDGIVAWQCNLSEAASHTETIEVAASHVGMGVNALAPYAVADRLSQDPRAWRKFDLAGARQWFCRLSHPAPVQARAFAAGGL